MSWPSTKVIKRDKVDRLFSVYIRTRDEWKCKNCGREFEEKDRRRLQCAHVWYSRRYYVTRFDERNCHALCFGCHNKLAESPGLAYEFIRDKTPRNGLANLVRKFSKRNDLKEQSYKVVREYIYEDIKRKLESLNN